MVDHLYETTMNRYEQEFSRTQHLDQKASNLIGFTGIIIAILSFAFGSNGIREINASPYFVWLIIGIGVLLFSIIMGITALTRFKKTLPVFIPEKFYDKYKDKTENEQREQILLGFFDLIYDFEKVNNRKAK